MGGGASGPAQATLSGVGFNSLSSAMTWTHALSPAFMSDFVSVRGVRVEADCTRFIELPSVSHEEYSPIPAAKKSLPAPSPWSPTGSQVKDTELVDMSVTRGCGI